MKRVFRVGLILVPFLFLLSTTAYSAGSDADYTAKSIQNRGRSPASLTDGMVKLNQLTPLDEFSQPTTQKKSSRAMRVASEVRPVTPPLGSGVGAAAPVYSW